MPAAARRANEAGADSLAKALKSSAQFMGSDILIFRGGNYFGVHELSDSPETLCCFETSMDPLIEMCATAEAAAQTALGM